MTSFTQDDEGVDVTLSDGSTGRYDLLIGADGLHSDVRTQLGIEVEPEPHRHGHLARVRAAPDGRHAHRARTTAAPSTSPATARPSDDMMYAYLVEPAQDRTALARGGLEVMRELPRAYGGPWDEIREHLERRRRA